LEIQERFRLEIIFVKAKMILQLGCLLLPFVKKQKVGF
jgi:hypothetical protein